MKYKTNFKLFMKNLEIDFTILIGCERDRYSVTIKLQTKSSGQEVPDYDCNFVIVD